MLPCHHGRLYKGWGGQGGGVVFLCHGNGADDGLAGLDLGEGDAQAAVLGLGIDHALQGAAVACLDVELTFLAEEQTKGPG